VPRVALDAGDGVRPMPGIVIFLIALSIMLPAAFGIMLVHHNVLIQPDGFGVGMSVFALIGALMRSPSSFRPLTIRSRTALWRP
jgi:hypothetical protein